MRGGENKHRDGRQHKNENSNGGSSSSRKAVETAGSPMPFTIENAHSILYVDLYGEIEEE